MISFMRLAPADFYPRPPRGGRRRLFAVCVCIALFLSTPSTRRATLFRQYLNCVEAISIHALHEEGDGFTCMRLSSNVRFLSTPSTRRATLNKGLASSITAISIHALHEEGDATIAKNVVSTAKFLSTPSTRRATCHTHQAVQVDLISIHALHEEGDQLNLTTVIVSSNFYPRPPRGGRHQTVELFCRNDKFLSTPSTRRATAKTERKPSAFVSLYTSLHKLQRDVCKPNRKITPLLAQTAGVPVRSVPENHVCCRFALAGHQKISTLSCANSGCSPTCSTFV